MQVPYLRRQANRRLRGFAETDPELPDTLSVPLTLTGSVTLNPGDSLPLNSDALKNPLQVPIAVYELKWALAVPYATKTQNTGITGDAVDCIMAIGSDPVTNGPTPLYNLGQTSDPEGDDQNVSVGSVTCGICFGVWRLDEPIYLNPGQGIDITLKHREMTTNPITATVAISGSAVRRVPGRKMIPYVSTFNPAAFLLDSGVTVVPATSAETDLVNSLSMPLDVRRIIGRVNSWGVPSGLVNTAPFIVISPNGNPAIRDALLAVQIRSMHGIPVIGGASGIPFGMAFPVPFHCIEIRHQMNAGDYYLVTITPTQMQAADNIQAHASISLIGYREVV